jgi:hypothetical protein
VVSDSRPDIAGARFHAELVEQPDALLRLLDEAAAAVGLQQVTLAA